MVPVNIISQQSIGSGFPLFSFNPLSWDFHKTQTVRALSLDMLWKYNI